MFFLIGAMIMALAGIFVLPARYCNRPYETPKKTLIAIGAAVFFVLWLFIDGKVRLSQGLSSHVVVLISWWILTSLVSPRPEIARKHLTIMMACAVFGLLILPGVSKSVSAGFFVIAASANAVFSSLQCIWPKKQFWKHLRPRDQNKVAFVGNTNWLGAYLVPAFILGLWLSAQSPWWVISLLPMMYCLYKIRCRGSYIALGAGLFVYIGSITTKWWIALLIPCAVLLVCARLDYLNTESLRIRLKFWHIAFLQIKKKLFFGIGPGVFITRVPYLQKELNQKTNGEYLKNHPEPFPEYAHNDFLQHTIDHGIFGAALMLVVIIYAFKTGGVFTPFGAALTGLLVNGLFFHTFSIPVTNLWFWYLIGVLGGGEAVVPGQVAIFAPFVAVVLSYGAVLAIKTQLKDYYLARWELFKPSPKAFKYLDKAYRIAPDDNYTTGYIGAKKASDNKLLEAFSLCYHSLEYYDGRMNLWVLWDNLGRVCMGQGNFIMAQSCFAAALKFLPGYSPASGNLKMVNSIIEKVREAQKQQKDRRLKKNGTETPGTN